MASFAGKEVPGSSCQEVEIAIKTLMNQGDLSFLGTGTIHFPACRCSNMARTDEGLCDYLLDILAIVIWQRPTEDLHQYTTSEYAVLDKPATDLVGLGSCGSGPMPTRPPASSESYLSEKPESQSLT